jgi:hypothetical protein
MRPGRWLVPLLYCVWLTFSTSAGAAPLADAVPGVRPTWTIGDWWIVESQVYDRGDKLPGAVPGWLDKETWLFSVASTDSIDGEPCYQVWIQPTDQNRCPYWFSCWFRMSDLLVMRRELHQPEATLSGRQFSAPVAQANYSKDEETPFVPLDFPSLPLTMPHFAGGMTNVYKAKVSSTASAPAPQGAPQKLARSLAALVTQTFHPNETLEHEQAFRPGSPTPPGAESRLGVFILAHAAEKYERQSWNSNLPWHVYGEKWEGGQLVRKSWLADWGHKTGSPTEPPAGGVK